MANEDAGAKSILVGIIAIEVVRGRGAIQNGTRASDQHNLYIISWQRLETCMV